MINLKVLNLALFLLAYASLCAIQAHALDVSGDDVGIYSDDSLQNPDEVPIDYTSDDPMPDTYSQ